MTQPELIDVYGYRWHEGRYEFLILKRAKGMIYEDEWRMVGGKIRASETASEAGLREFTEETGLVPETFWCVPTINSFFDFHRNKVHHIPVFAAACRADSRPVLNHEHTQWAWKTLSEISRYIVWPEHQRIINVIHHLLSEEKLSHAWFVPVSGKRSSSF